MNLRTFSAISAVSMLVLGGCIVVGNTPGGGNGGTGGTGGEGNASTSSSSSGTAGAGVGGAGGGTGGTGGAAACAKTCADAVTDGVPVCESSPASLALYDALATCTCQRSSMDADPGCKEACGDNLCVGMMTAAACGDCVQKAGCSDEFGACSADF